MYELVYGRWTRENMTLEYKSGDSPEEFVSQANENGWEIISLSVTQFTASPTSPFNIKEWWALVKK